MESVALLEDIQNGIRIYIENLLLLRVFDLLVFSEVPSEVLHFAPERILAFIAFKLSANDIERYCENG